MKEKTLKFLQLHFLLGIRTVRKHDQIFRAVDQITHTHTLYIPLYSISLIFFFFAVLGVGLGSMGNVQIHAST